MVSASLRTFDHELQHTDKHIADLLGSGSTQATTDSADNGKDQAFWDALNSHVQNLHAVISGHGLYSFPTVEILLTPDSLRSRK